MSTFGERLRALRRANDWTQEEISKLLSMVRSTYAYYETGKTSPDYKTLVKIANLFDVTTDYLLGNDEAATASNSVMMRDESLPRYKTEPAPEPASLPPLETSSIELKGDSLRFLQAYNFLDESTKRRLLVDLERLALIQYSRLENNLEKKRFDEKSIEEERQIIDNLTRNISDSEKQYNSDNDK